MADRRIPGWLPPLDREDLIRTRRIPITHWTWIASTTVVAAGLLAWVMADGALGHALSANPGPLALAAVLIFLGELFGVMVARRDDTTTQANLSMAVSVALLASGPLAVLILVQGLAVVCDDVRHRRAPFKVAYNLSQYIVALVAARAVYALLTGVPLMGGPTSVGPGSVLPMLVAGMVYVLVNELQVSVTASLITGERVFAPLVNDITMTLPVTLVLVGSAPVVGYLLFHALWLTPLLLLPALAVAATSQVAAHRHRVSLSDPLTGLANRILFNQRLERALQESAGVAEPSLAVLLLDVDHFKDVNDVLGHHTGDLLLVELAARSGALVRTDDTVARLGGDEFAVLLRGADVATRAGEVAQALLTELSRPIELHNSRLSVQGSVGVVIVAQADLTGEEVVRRADIALYAAKQERSCYCVYTEDSTDSGSAVRLSLLGDLRHALATGALEVRYQPIVDATSGRVVGAEALSRWQHGVHGWLSPSLFIPLAESAGMIAELTQQVLLTSLSACREWSRAGAELGVAVNVSTRLVSDAALPAMVRDALIATGVAADRLTIEVTESGVVTDPSRAMVVLAELHNLGVRLSVDEFGTGYSSLALLQHLQVDEVKVDRGFVAGVDSVPNDAVLVGSTVTLAHSLGLDAVAVGVENDAVAQALRGMGCERLQGYLFGASMTAAQVADLAGARVDDQQPPAAALVDLTDGQDNRTLVRAPGARVVRLPSPRSTTLVR